MAAPGEMSGSRPLPLPVIASAGSGAFVSSALTARNAAAREERESRSAGFNGPRFEAPELRASYLTALGRPQKYVGLANDCPTSLDPTAIPQPSYSTLPSALARKASCAPA